MISALDHVIVAVSDLAAATRHLRTLLGRGPSWRGSHPGYGTENTLFRVSNSYLELLAPTGVGPVADGIRARLDAEGEGLVGLAFGTHDASALAAALNARGITAAAPQPGVGRDEESGAFRRWHTVWLPREQTRGTWLFAIQHETPPDVLPQARAIASEQACVFALDHVVVESGDVEASKHLYGDVLGLRLALDRRFDARGLRMLFFRTGGVTLEVVGRLDAPLAPHDQLGGLAWRVPDVDATRARLLAGDVDVSEVRAGRKPGTRVCTVRRDTCGVPTLLIEPAASSKAASDVR